MCRPYSSSLILLTKRKLFLIPDDNTLAVMFHHHVLIHSVCQSIQMRWLGTLNRKWYYNIVSLDRDPVIPWSSWVDHNILPRLRQYVVQNKITNTAFTFVWAQRKDLHCTLISLKAPHPLGASSCWLLRLFSRISAGIGAVVQRAARSSCSGTSTSSALSPTPR